jgi:hypothetical protein
MKGIAFLALAGLVAVGAFRGQTTAVEPAPKPKLSVFEKSMENIPLETTKDDLLTRLGRVYERDNYWLGKKLDQESPNWRSGSKFQPKPVDEHLTAEEFFEANSSSVHGLILFDLSKCEDNPRRICDRSLSESETLRLWGLNRLHNMAALVLYKRQCSGSQTFSAIDKIERQFDRLPEDVRSKAMSREIRGIESVKSYHYEGGRIPGGWTWFCKMMQDHLSEGRSSEIFRTASDNYFPVGEER